MNTSNEVDLPHNNLKIWNKELTNDKALAIAENAARHAGITHRNSIMAAAKAISAMYEEGTATALIYALAQSGKTAAQIIFAHATPDVFRLLLGVHGPLNIGVFFLTNISLKSILQQTEDRLAETSFSQPAKFKGLFVSQYPGVNGSSDRVYLKTILLSSGAGGRGEINEKTGGTLITTLDRFKQAGCTHFVFILDEAHVGVKNGQQLSIFLDQIGIKTPTDHTSQFTPPTLFLGSTATPYQAYVLPSYTKPLSLIRADAGIGYYGLVELNNANRLKKAPPILKIADAKSLLAPHIKEGELKNYIVRVNSKNSKFFKAAAKELNMEVLEYNSGEKNLERLGKDISKAPFDQNTLFVIKRGIGAGVTIDSVKHIGAWIDVGYTNVESLVQSVCRSCGYTSERQSATYPIYCDVDKIQNYIEADEKIKNGELPTPDALVKKRKLKGKKTNDIEWVPDGDTAEFSLLTLKDAEAVAKKCGWFSEHGFSYMGDNDAHNIAEMILQGSFGQLKTRFIVPGENAKWEKEGFAYQRLQDRFPALHNNDSIYRKGVNDNGLVFCPINLIKRKKAMRVVKSNNTILN